MGRGAAWALRRRMVPTPRSAGSRWLPSAPGVRPARASGAGLRPRRWRGPRGPGGASRTLAWGPARAGGACPLLGAPGRRRSISRSRSPGREAATPSAGPRRGRKGREGGGDREEAAGPAAPLPPGARRGDSQPSLPTRNFSNPRRRIPHGFRRPESPSGRGSANTRVPRHAGGGTQGTPGGTGPRGEVAGAAKAAGGRTA